MGGIFGGGGGGGGKQTQTSEASYPPEFRDLATSARKQIEALQAALPLVSHAGFQPAGVAGLSPVEQFTINELVMRAPYLPATFASLMELPEPVGAASRGAVRAGEGSRGAAGALEAAAGLAILVGWRTRWAVLALIVYLVPITWYTHVAVAQAAVDQVVKDQEFFQALKNLAVIGGLLLLRSSGPGRHSLDGN